VTPFTLSSCVFRRSRFYKDFLLLSHRRNLKRVFGPSRCESEEKSLVLPPPSHTAQQKMGFFQEPTMIMFECTYFFSRVSVFSFSALVPYPSVFSSLPNNGSGRNTIRDFLRNFRLVFYQMKTVRSRANWPWVFFPDLVRTSLGLLPSKLLWLFWRATGKYSVSLQRFSHWYTYSDLCRLACISPVMTRIFISSCFLCSYCIPVRGKSVTLGPLAF